MTKQLEAMKMALKAIEDLDGYRKDIDEAIAALREAIEAADGYVLVPVEPTDEMVDAACAAVDDLYRVDFVRAYEAAIAQQKGGA